MVGRAPVPDQEVNRLRALLVGLFALVLVAQAAAAAFGGTSASPSGARHDASAKPASRSRALTLDEQLRLKLTEDRRHRGMIRFFENHPKLLRSGGQRSKALATLRNARRRIAQLRPEIAHLRTAIRRRDARLLEAMPPRQAICDVFGRDCHAAVAVAWCESRLNTTAQNGQYLGLFQMGALARRLYGHGPSAHEQAVAAHRYYVDSGRNWGPWSCRWAAS